jgi:cytochrome P450
MSHLGVVQATTEMQRTFDSSGSPTEREVAPAPRLPPGPAPRRGGLLETARYAFAFATDPIGFVSQRFERYGDLYYAPAKGTGLYVVRHPDHLLEVLSKRSRQYSKSHSALERMLPIVGRGLLTSDGELWKRHRRMLQPAFTKKRLSTYVEVMAVETEETLRSFAPGQTRDISRDMMELTLRIVSRSLFNHDVREQTDAVRDAMRALNETMSRPDLLPPWFPSPSRTRTSRALARFDALIYRLIDERRATIARGEPTPDDMLQALVTAVDDEGDGGGLERTEVRDQLITFFLAGHETTSHALTWTWSLLARNPHVLETLHRELDDVLGNRDLTAEDLPALQVTERVLLEAMRLYPPAYVLARKAVEDTEIGGYPVPAGSEVVAWIYLTHHDPRWYPDPEAFRPERFAPDAIASRPKLSYLPFGAGPRACIGQHFSMLESKIVLATIARRFTLELAPGHRIAPHWRVTLAPKHGMRMRLRARTRAR